MIKSFIALVLISCGLGAFHTAAAANLVTNPGFETGDFTGWTLSGTDSSPEDYGTYYGVDTVDAHSGNYGAYFGPAGGVLYLSQLLTTVQGDGYSINFWLQETPGTIFPYTNSLSVSFGSATLVSQTDVSGFPYTLFTYDAFATSNQTSLVFGFRDDVGYFSLDDISVTPEVVKAPEPSSAGLVFMVLLILWCPHFLRFCRSLRPFS
jgi:hypothetical protein